jgi:ketosteroid isomerase-like protein
MTRRIAIVTVFGLVFWGVACTPPGDYAARSAADATLAAEEDMAQLVVDWDDAMAAGEVEDAVALYAADDAVIMPPDAPAVGGADEIAAFFGDMFSGGGLFLSNQHDRVLSSGDLVIARGNYTWTKTDESGDPSDEIGKWTCIARRNEEGTLEIVRNIWNRDVPPPGATPPMGAAES